MREHEVVEILRRELGRRCGANPRYSLRAFARALGISPANLSLVLSRKRLPSERTLKSVLECVDMSPRERSALVRAGVRKASVADGPAGENVSLETVERISHWISYAILSLTETKGFRSNERWIARRLGVSMHEVRTSLEALRTVGMLDTASLPWRQTHAPIRLNNRASSSIARAFHRQTIAKALDALENEPVEERDFSSITFAMSRKHMAQAKEEIRCFRLRMCELFEEKGKSEDVYNLTVQMVAVTKGENDG